MKKVLIFPASQRNQSINQRLANYLADSLIAELQIDLLSADVIDLPLFNQDLEKQPLILDKVKPIHQRFFEADGLIIVTPEYNGSFSPYLKNTVDWISRLHRLLGDQGYKNPFQGKPLLLASATPGGSGGILGMQSARLVFSYLGSLMLAEQISLPFALNAWGEDGELNDAVLNAKIAETLDRFVAIVQATPSIFIR